MAAHPWAMGSAALLASSYAAQHASAAPLISGQLYRAARLASDGLFAPQDELLQPSAANDAPAGTDKIISMLEDGTYIFSAGDFGFSDPNEAAGTLTPALTATDVLVLYNASSSAGAQIANYYASIHPGVQLLGITGLDPGAEQISADTYLSVIRPQVMAALTSSIDVIVTTKGMPLRINVTQSPPVGSTYVDGSGVTRSILSWKSYSSLESELAMIDTVSNWQMMGDQSFAVGSHFSANPYYLSNSAFSHNAFGTRLTARLDGYTVSDVLASIDRAQNAYVGPNNSPSGPFFFVIDGDPTKSYAPTMANLYNNVLSPNGLPVVYDNTSAFVSTAPGPVIGYTGHGIHQASTPAEYLLNGFDFDLANGAVFSSWESYNAYSFNPATTTNGHQGQVAEWLAIGGTAGVGHVEEPGASTSSVTNEDKLYRMLLNGYTFAEAAWSATRQVSFVNTMIGDPLMTWKPWTPIVENELLAVKITTLPTVGTLTLNGSAVTAGQFISVADIHAGQLRFMPPPNANGVNLAQFTFQVQDDGGTAGGGVDLDPTPNTITFNVTSVNDAPSGADKTVNMVKDAVYTFSTADFGYNDPYDSPANALQLVRIVTLPALGALTNNNVAVTPGQSISAADVAGGKLKFTPAPGTTGVSYASFTFQVGDAGGTMNGGANLDPSANTIFINVSISANENFVRGLYFDILGRAPDPGGLATWTGQLNSGISRSAVANALWQVPEHRGRQVDQYYQTFLNRAADSGGRQHWINQMRGGMSEEAVISAFVMTNEYKKLYPTSSAISIALYEDILNRTPSSFEVADRANALDGATQTYSDIVRSLVDSRERHRKLVDTYYQQFLNRQPDPGGRNYWGEQLDKKVMSDAAVAIALLATPEYFNIGH